MEIYKDVVGYEGIYQVSNLGNVRSLDRTIKCKNSIRTYKGCQLKKLKHTAGYLGVNIRRSKRVLIHRMVAQSFIPNPKNKEFVNHKNGIKADNRVENLEWTTRQENENHAFNTGLKNSTGSHNTMAKLNETKVQKIKELSKSNVKCLSSLYKVHRATIQRIINGKIWQHV